MTVGELFRNIRGSTCYEPYEHQIGQVYTIISEENPTEVIVLKAGYFNEPNSSTAFVCLMSSRKGYRIETVCKYILSNKNDIVIEV